MTIIPQPRTMLRMVTQPSDQRDWLEGLLKRYRLTATELARRADLNPSTLTRFLQPGGRDGHELSRRTLRKIEETLKLTSDLEQASSPHGFSEAEAHQIFAAENLPADIRVAASAIKGGRNGIDIWEIRTTGLESIRLYVGDIAIVDVNAQPIPRDRVCAQIYDNQRGTARTIFRLYEPPYILTGGIDRPEVVDGRNVLILGVVIASLSPRNLLHISTAA